MSTALSLKTISNSVDDTVRTAAAIGQRLRGGEVIELISDLGGGKTAFVGGLARGMGSRDKVHSPSFTLSNQYRADNLVLYHFDFYRLNEPGIMRNEIAELIADPKTVLVIEWAAIVADILPVDRLAITFQVTGETSRSLCITYPEQLKYLTSSIT